MIGTMSSQMVSTSSNNSGLVSRGHSTVGVGHQVRDVQGTSIGMMDCRGSNMVDGSMVGSGHSIRKRFMVHLHGLYFSGQLVGSKCDNHAWLNNTSFDTTNRNCSNSTNFVHILKGKSQRLVCRSGWRNDRIKGLKQG